MKRRGINLCLLFVLFYSVTIANNLTISNVSLTSLDTDEKLITVQFNVSWQNSWRLSSATPYNWDAVWLFVKYQIDGGEWKQAYLNSSGHTAPSGSTINLGLLSPGSAYNSSTNPGVGAFIYKSTTGYGALSLTNVQLCWNYGSNGVTNDASVIVKVMGVEMVYITSGGFSVGDGTQAATLCKANDTSYPYDTYYINSASGPIIQGNNPSSSSSNLTATWGLDITGTTTASLASGFPNGYNAIYCMKHEISQRQYVEFLNMLTRVQQDARTATSLSSGTTSVTNRFVMSNTPTVSYRNGVSCSSLIHATEPITFFCDLDGDGTGDESNDGGWIACNYLSWADVAAYLDWCGLRPMTELEFEKICRANYAPISGEYAWGNSSNIDVDPADRINSSGQYNETPTGPSGNNANCAFNNYPDVQGPVRVGAFAKSTSTTRVQSGATYFGVLEMSGNVDEKVVVINNSTGRSFNGSHGNGEVNSTGDADANSWPGTNAVGAGRKGGFWQTTIASYMCVSNRVFCGSSVNTNRYEYYGGRGVRTAP